MDGRAYYKISDGKLIGVFNRTGRKNLSVDFSWLAPKTLKTPLFTGENNFKKNLPKSQLDTIGRFQLDFTILCNSISKSPTTLFEAYHLRVASTK